MAYNVSAKFFKFAKKINSTRRPSEQPSTMLERSVEIMEPFNLLTPTIKVVDVDLGEGAYSYFLQFNYIKLGDTNGNGREIDRYYWIRNWRREGGVNYAECEVDALASWRGVIFGTTPEEGRPNYQLIERTSKASNYFLNDSMRPKTMRTTKSVINAVGHTGRWSFDDPTAIFIMYPSATISTAGAIEFSPGNVFGGTTSSRDAFMKHISDVLWYYTTWTLPENPDPSEEPNSLSLSSGKTVKDFVSDYYLLPYDWDYRNTNYHTFTFGEWDFTTTLPKKDAGGAVRFELSNGEGLTPMTNITDVKLIASWNYMTSDVLLGEQWLNTSEYVNAEITIQPFGTMTIPIDLLQFGTQFAIQIHADIQGNAVLSVKCGERECILATSNVRYVDSYKYAPRATTGDVDQIRVRTGFGTAGLMYNTIANTAANMFSFAGNTLSFAQNYITNMENASASIAAAAYPNGVHCTGVSGTTIISEPIVTIMRYNVAEPVREKYGYPYHKFEPIILHIATENNPGFVRCSGASLEFPTEDYTPGRNGNASMTVTEKTSICDYLNGGIYLE